MRILHVASGREWRGGQRQTWLLARGLARIPGISQTIVTARDGELARRLEEAALPVRGAKWRWGLDPRAAFTVWLAARGADLLHAHDAHAVTLAAVAARLTHQPFIATRRMTRPLRRPGPWRRATRVIAISGPVRDTLVRSGIASERIEVIPPAIEVDRTSQVKPIEWFHAYGIPLQSPVVVTVAALTREKGIDTLLEAAAAIHPRLPQLHWVVAGDGVERPALETRAGALHTRPYVHFVGHLSDPLPVISGAAVLVLPSREEGFGSVILDAMALGIPVAASAVGGVPEALAGGGGELVPAGDGAALAAVVERMVGDVAHRMRLGESGRRAVRRFDLDAMVERVVAVYRSVKESIEAQ
ncbi:MAG TPA: glycosyltransferase [Gemmatimonadales bacterium]